MKQWIHIRQFETGNQGLLLKRGVLLAEVVNIQLLESPRGLVSGTPQIRVGQFVSVNGDLREVQERKGVAGNEETFLCVTLHENDKLPSEGEDWAPEEN